MTARDLSVSSVAVRRLREDDDRSTFNSGDERLDRFFRLYARQNQFEHHVGTTYVAVDSATGTVVGFATLAAASIARDELPAAAQKSLPSYPLPALRLARLAVDRNAQGRGIGKLLLRAVFVAAHQLARLSGCVGVVVDAKAEALGFYASYGFEALEVEAGELQVHPEPTPMFLELGAIPADPDFALD